MSSTKDSVYSPDELRDDIARLLLDRLGEDSLLYLHSSDLSRNLDTNASRVGRNLKSAAERAGLRAEKWAHNGNSTTWLVERVDAQEESADDGDDESEPFVYREEFEGSLLDVEHQLESPDHPRDERDVRVRRFESPE